MSGASIAGHEIPTDITAHVFVKPDRERVRLLIRVPLRAMRDVNFPTVGPGYLAIDGAEPMLRDAALLWIAPNIQLREEGRAIDGQRLVRSLASLPSDRSFVSFDEAMAHLEGSVLPATERLPWDAALLDMLFEYPIQSDRSHFAVRLDFARLASRVTTVVRFVQPDGDVRALEYAGDPGWIELDPRWYQAAWTFVRLGLAHILDGIDHILFLLCLVVPFRRVRSLVLIVTAFTVAHSITLIGAAFGFVPDGLWFPPLVETLIAISIAYMAIENIVLEWQGAAAAAAFRRRWVLAFAFGLVHGFGFSFALRESLQFAGSHLLTSLLSFNLGVELGQLIVVAALVPSLSFLFRYVMPERIGAVVISALIAHTSWHWMTERWRILQAFGWPALEAASLASALRWMTVMLLIGAAGWGLSAVVRQQLRRTSDAKSDATPPRWL
ncbi:MAG: HupE/UreJ family protein [Vicinamibacterales bacterium]